MQSLNLRQVANALPQSSSPRIPLSLPVPSGNSAKQRKQLPVLPDCFAPIIQRVTSTLPHHRRQRATLESVALSLPPAAAALTGSSSAAAYLAALVSALNRLTSTTPPIHLPHSLASRQRRNEQRGSKKQARKDRLEQSRQQEQVSNMSVHSLVAPETVVNEITMTDDGPIEDKENEGEETPQAVGVVTGFVSLIALAVHGCSHAVINVKADAILTCIINAYDHTSGYVSVAHHANTVFASVLSILSPSAWTSTHVNTAFLLLLRHTADVADEAFRFNSRRALSALLYCPRGALVATKASTSAAVFFTEKLKTGMTDIMRDELNERERATATESLLQYLSSIGNYGSFLLPKDAAKIATELVVIAVKDIPDVSAHAYSALGSLFSVRGIYAAADDDSSDNPLLAQSDLSKLVLAVMNHNVPDECSDELVVAYTTCVASGAVACVIRHVHISPSDDFIYKPVRKLFDAIQHSNGNNGITRSICRGFQVILSNKWFISKPVILTILQKFIDTKYRAVWTNVISVLRKYLETGICAGNEQMRSSVRLLVSGLVTMRERGFEEEDQKLVDISESVLKAVSRGGGASIILDRCPVTYDVKHHVTNGWVLTILRDNVIGSTLSSFVTYLVPVGQKLDAAMKQKLEDKRVIEAKNIGIYKLQIWALLPGFCSKPTDLLHDNVLTLAFKGVHLCFTSDERENLFPVGVAALRQLSLSVLGLSSEDPLCKDKIEGFATRYKKLFPTLVNSITNCTDERRAPLLYAICVGCKATRDEGLVATLLRKTIRQLLELQLKLSSLETDRKDDSMTDDEGKAQEKEKDQIKKQQHSSADLAIAIAESNMIPAGAAEIGYLEKAMSPFFLDRKDGALQKKAYRVSAMLITSDVVTKEHDKFMEFVKNTSEAHGSLAAGAKAVRMAWITAIVNHYLKIVDKSQGNREEYLKQLNEWFLSEVMLSTRDSSEKSRSAAFETLVNFARGWNNVQPRNDVSGFQNFLLAVCAGFGGKSSTMLAGSLSSIGRLIETFRYEIADSAELSKFVDSLFATQVAAPNDGDDDVAMEKEEGGIGNNEKMSVEGGPVAILMRHESVEVQRAAVAVVKVATKCCNDSEGIRLRRIVGGIVPGLVYVAAKSNKKETRLRVRLVIERLMRKCGIEVMERVFPDEHKKLLVSVRRQFVRERNKKFALKEQRMEGYGGGGGDDDDSDDNEKGYIPEEEDDESDDDGDVEKDLIEGDKVTEKIKVVNMGKVHGNDVVDLLENKASLTGRRVVMTKSGGKGNQIKKKRLVGSKGVDTKYSDDGKPIFVESDDGSGGAEAGSLDGHDDISDDDNESKGKQQIINKLNGKRRMDERYNDTGDRNVKKMKGSFGEEYKGRRGRGDVKRANRPDPFAYVPLGPSMFAAGTKPGMSNGKQSRGTALDRLKSKKASGKARGRGGRSGLPARR